MEADLWKRLTGIGKCVCLNHHSGLDITFVYLTIWNWPANSDRTIGKSSKCTWMTGVGRHLKEAMSSGTSAHYLKLLWPPHMPSLSFRCWSTMGKVKWIQSGCGAVSEMRKLTVFEMTWAHWGAENDRFYPLCKTEPSESDIPEQVTRKAVVKSEETPQRWHLICYSVSGVMTALNYKKKKEKKIEQTCTCVYNKDRRLKIPLQKMWDAVNTIGTVEELSEE